MMPDLNQFLSNCNDKYKNEYYPFLTNELEKNQKKLIPDNNTDISTGIGALLGSSLGYAIKASNYLAIKQLENYHNWLLENYDIKPKKL